MASSTDDQNKSNDPELTFAGFTESEWVSARSLLLGTDEANEEVGRLFSRLRFTRSNGFSVPAEHWALLSLVNDDCARRVREAIETYPAAFKANVDALANAYTKLIQAGTLRSAFAAARRKYWESEFGKPS